MHREKPKYTINNRTIIMQSRMGSYGTKLQMSSVSNIGIELFPKLSKAILIISLKTFH